MLVPPIATPRREGLLGGSLKRSAGRDRNRQSKAIFQPQMNADEHGFRRGFAGLLPSVSALPSVFIRVHLWFQSLFAKGCQ